MSFIFKYKRVCLFILYMVVVVLVFVGGYFSMRCIYIYIYVSCVCAYIRKCV